MAGVLVAQVGVAAVFAPQRGRRSASSRWRCARWRPGDARAVEVPERFTAALRAGGRYVRHSPIVRRLLRRALVFVIPASALWALLPLVASPRLGLDAGGYGLLLAALGVGAIGGGVLLPRIRTRLSPNQLLLLAGALYGGTLIVVASVRIRPGGAARPAAGRDGLGDGARQRQRRDPALPARLGTGPGPGRLPDRLRRRAGRGRVRLGCGRRHRRAGRRVPGGGRADADRRGDVADLAAAATCAGRTGTRRPTGREPQLALEPDPGWGRCW